MEEISLAQAIEKGREWGAPAPLAPLILHYDVCVLPDDIERNIRQSMKRAYKPFNLLLSHETDRELSIVGFGPSIENTWKELRGDVWACNGAHNWLIEKGVIPKFGFFWDAAEVVAKFVNPHPDVTYLVASRCHEEVFKKLEGFDVYVWHAMGDPNIEDILIEHKRMEPMLGHGTAAVTASLMLAPSMGYRKVSLFGADSSFVGEHTHAKESVVTETKLEIWVAGEKFKSTSWLAGQVEDFKKLAPLLRDAGVSIELHGGGLLQKVAAINGFTVHKPNAATCEDKCLPVT